MSESAPAGGGVSAGTLLRQAREAAGLHVATLAANLKVPVRKLEALEEDRYEELPDAVFVRALASSVCRTLKVDAAPVLERLPQTRRPQFAQDPEGINAPFRAPSDGPPPGLLHQVSRPVVLTVVALLLAALVVFFLPVVQSGLESVLEANRPGSADAGAPATPAPAGPAGQVEMAPAAVPGGPGLPAEPAPGAGAPPMAGPVTQAPEAPLPAPPADPGVQLRTSAGTAAGQPAAAGSGPGAADAAAASAVPQAQGIVVFRARAESWVQVRDARGTTVMQKLLAAGETAGASGALPLSVVVGSARSTEVQVRGRPLDLKPLTRGDDVARFEVK